MTRLDKRHARIVGGVLNQIDELLARARAIGLRTEAQSKLEGAVMEMRSELSLPRKEPSLREAQGLLAQLFVFTFELRPEALKGYGEVPAEEGAYLERQSARLNELAARVLDEFEQQSRTEVG